MKVTRREAMQLMAAGGVYAFSPPLWAAMEKKIPDLAVITGEDPVANTQAAVDALGGMARFVTKGDKVVIKPNMGFGNTPSAATTTDPGVVRSLAKQALNAGAKRVMVLDNPCHRADIALEVTGIKNVLKGLDDVFAFTVTRDEMFGEVSIPKGISLKKVHIARDILEADCIINAPMAKSHSSAKVSFGMKNWMGAIRDRKKWHVILDLNQAIADLASYIKPKLTVLDATRTLVTGGPGGPGTIEQTQTVVAGVDPVAVDSYGLKLAKFGGENYRPHDIEYLIMAKRHGVGDYPMLGTNIYRKTL